MKLCRSYILFICLLALNARASETCQRGPLSSRIFGGDTVLDLQEKAFAFVEALKPWRAASDQQIKEARCRKEIPNIAEMVSELKTMEKTDRDKLKEHFEEMINKEATLFTSFQVETDLSDKKFSHCASLICFSQTLFGKTRGVKFLWMKAKLGLNPSHIVEPEARPWKKGEIDPYLKAAMNLPEGILPLKTNMRFIQQAKAQEGQSVANASLAFFPGMKDFSDEAKEYTAFHEIGHYISMALEIDHDPEWVGLSAWKVDPVKKFEIEKALGKYDMPPVSLSSFDSFSGRGVDEQLLKIQIHHNAMISEKEDSIISRYGHKNPSEDFAESMVAYRYNPEALKNISPSKYDFIKKKVFSGKEYLSLSDCQ